MRNIYKIALMTTIFFSLAFATADGPDYWKVRGVASDDVLWIHPTPNYRSERIGQIPYNATCLKNIECTGNISFTEYQRLSPEEKRALKKQSRWCKVKYQNRVGWVNGKYLIEDGNCP